MVNGDARKQVLQLVFEITKFILLVLIIPALAALWQLDRSVTLLGAEVASVNRAIKRHDIETKDSKETLGMLHHEVISKCNHTKGCHSRD